MRERAARDLATMVTVYAEIHSPEDIWKMITEGADLPKLKELEKCKESENKQKKTWKYRSPAEKQAASVRRREYKRYFQRLLRLGMKRGRVVSQSIEKMLSEKFAKLRLPLNRAAAFERNSTPCPLCGGRKPDPSCEACHPGEADVLARKRGRRP